jgi:hypothetical protein
LGWPRSGAANQSWHYGPSGRTQLRSLDDSKSWAESACTEIPPASDADALHTALFAGAIARFREKPEMAAIVAFTRAFLEEHLAPHDPVLLHLLDGDLGERCRALQRDYANAAEVKRLWTGLITAVGLDPEQTARDRLILRFQPPIAGRAWTRHAGTLAFHRDTWGSNLYAQVNWWAPVYSVTAGRTFAFLPELFAQPLANSSDGYDICDLIARNRGNGRPVGPGEMVPRLMQEVDLSSAQPVTIAPGEVIVFSSQHAHVGVPNHTDVTRISLDTRTIRVDDIEAGRGAPNVDGRGRWISYGMLRRISDGTPLADVLGVRPFEPFDASLGVVGPSRSDPRGPSSLSDRV